MKRHKNKYWREKIGNYLGTWIPFCTVLVCCNICLFPWADLWNRKIDFLNFVLDKNSLLAIIIISYVVMLAKNNFDSNQKIMKRLDEIYVTDADSLFIFREELEPFSKLFSEADSVSFSGGHLNSVIIGAEEELLDFLKKVIQRSFYYPIQPIFKL